jgi:hypothetical protein
MPLIRGPRSARHEVMSCDDKLFPAAFRQLTTVYGLPPENARNILSPPSRVKQQMRQLLPIGACGHPSSTLPPRFDTIPVISPPEPSTNLAHGRLPYRLDEEDPDT